MKKIKLLRRISLTIFAFIIIAGMNAYAEYEKESAIFSLDFDETDNAPSFKWSNDNNSLSDVEVIPENGIVELKSSDFSGRAPVIKLDSRIDVSKKKNLYLEVRLKQNTDEQLSGGKPFLKWTGSSGNYFASIYCRDGNLYYGKGNQDNPSNASLKTDYTILGNEWYTIRMHIYNQEKKVSVEIIPDNEELPVYNEEYAAEKGYEFIQPLMWYNLDYLASLSLPYLPEFGNTSLDYIHIWDDDFKVIKSSISNGENDVPADSEMTLTFSSIPRESSLNNIYVRDSKNNNVPYEVKLNGKDAELFFNAGLKYNEDYTVTVPATVVNENNETLSETVYKFKTEFPALYIDTIQSTITEGTAKTSVFISNNGTEDKEYYILNLLYDEENNLVKMTNEKFVIAAGEEKTITSETVGEDAVTVSGYLWDGIDFIY